ncbi:MAG: hypothetical protein ACRDQ7_02070, partial [Haloechinothrix sp.]
VGHRWRTTFARAAGISVRSLNSLESGDPGVGQSILFAVGRALPNWTEDTPKMILEGGPIPSTATDEAPPEWEPRDEWERTLAADFPDMSRKRQAELFRMHRKDNESRKRGEWSTQSVTGTDD